MLGWRAEPGGDEQRAELVAVQCNSERLVVHPRAADVRGGILRLAVGSSLDAAASEIDRYVV